MIESLSGSVPKSPLTIDEPRVTVEGSERSANPHAKRIGAVDASQRIDVTIRLRPKNAIPDRYDASSDRAAVEERYASSSADAARVAAFAKSAGLDVVGTDLESHALVVSGDLAHLSSAFDVELERYSGEAGEYRGREGVISVPKSIGDAVTGVFGLDDRDQGLTRMKPLTTTPQHAFTPVEVANAYHFPDNDGAGARIGIVSLGGRYDDATERAYQKALGVEHRPITIKPVDGGSETPDEAGPTGENMLDAEVIGTVAPAADTAMYIGMNSDRGFLDTLSTAIHDKAHPNDAISISWGSPESNYTEQFFRAMNEEMREAKAMGINVFAASGDNGAADATDDHHLHADFPASSDGAIGTGGTKLTVKDGEIAKEVVWNELPDEGAGGGGVSDRVPLPPFQRGSHVPPSETRGGGRGVPDIAGNADPVTGYVVMLPPDQPKGQPQTGIVGGTSAVAPLYAALAARLGTALGHPVHDLQDAIYAAPAGAFHDVTQGNNGGYAAGPGWDAASGRGSIDGEKMLAYLRGKSEAKDVSAT